jgi:hypothetical protein
MMERAYTGCGKTRRVSHSEEASQRRVSHRRPKVQSEAGALLRMITEKRFSAAYLGLAQRSMMLELLAR